MTESDPAPCLLDPRKDCLLVCDNREQSEIALGQWNQTKTWLRSRLSLMDDDGLVRLIKQTIDQQGGDAQIFINYYDILDELDLLAY